MREPETHTDPAGGRSGADGGRRKPAPGRGLSGRSRQTRSSGSANVLDIAGARRESAALTLSDPVLSDPDLAARGAIAGDRAPLDPALLDAFARALCDDEAAAAATAAEQRRACGSSSQMFERLFAPAARRLGEWWVSDEICFVTVALGMATLQRLLWTAGHDAPPPMRREPQARLLLAPLPGEQHTFGLNMLCEQLRAAGAWVCLLAAPTREELVAAVRSGGFDTVGLSVGSSEDAPAIGPLARALRDAAPAPLHLIAGGPAAAALAGDAAELGLDEVVVEAPLAHLCTRLFQSAAVRPRSVAAA